MTPTLAPTDEDAVIAEALRSPIGRALKGGIADTRTDDLGALVLRALLRQVGVEAEMALDEVIAGVGYT